MKKWNLGSDKVLSVGSTEYEKLLDLIQKLNKNESNRNDRIGRYYIQDCWEDYGAKMKWTTVLYAKYNKTSNDFHSVQILNPKQWIDLANGDITVENLADEILKNR